LVKNIIYKKSPSDAILIGSGYTNLELVDVLYNMKIKPVILEKSATILPSFAVEIRAKVLEIWRRKESDSIPMLRLLRSKVPWSGLQPETSKRAWLLSLSV
jgi:pyruvate/2-oxoglutarate dehydrogenase complex dihydrolipoamide dehydrogenase (E3) component